MTVRIIERRALRKIERQVIIWRDRMAVDPCGKRAISRRTMDVLISRGLVAKDLAGTLVLTEAGRSAIS